MIGRLRGELANVDGFLAMVDVGGVGYEVTLPESVALQLPALGEPVTLLTRQVFREDGVTLYGFLEPFERRLFDLLLAVNGCGPKVALSLIGQIGADNAATAILNQDAMTLRRANGVGTKLAERLVLELKDKMQQEALVRKIEASTPKKKAVIADELVEALMALGYRRSEAETAAEEARGNASTVEDQIRHALRLLQK